VNPVVILQATEVTIPTVTTAVVVVFPLAEEVCRMAMVSPLLTFETGPAVMAAPFIEIPVQPAPQVTVTPLKPAPRASVLLVVAELTDTPRRSAKAPKVVTPQLVEMRPPTATLAVVPVLPLPEEVCCMAIVSPLLTP
jgi:hypothetical protein